jgi:hypothetical protein
MTLSLPGHRVVAGHTPACYVRLDECVITATQLGAAWWDDLAPWLQRAGMVTYRQPAPTFFGGLAYVHCHSRERAEELLQTALGHGVPPKAAHIVDRIPTQTAA